MFCCDLSKWRVYSLFHPIVQCFRALQDRIFAIFRNSLPDSLLGESFYFTLQGRGGLDIQESAVSSLQARHIKPADGVSGAVFVLDKSAEDPTSKKIGVYKPKESRELCVSLAFKRVFGQNSYLNEETKSEAEYFAFVLSNLLGLSITPETAIVYRDEARTQVCGSFQRFARENATYDQKVEWLSKENYTEKELVLFQKYALFDFIIGNLDRHLDNVFMTLEKGELTEIVAIDNGNSFPNTSTRYYGLLPPPINQYAWARFPVGEIPLCQETKSWIREKFTIENLESFFASSPDFFSQEKKDLFTKRFVLIARAANNDNFLLSDCLRYRYDLYMNQVRLRA